MQSVKSIAWLAGLLEGEGCFLLSSNGDSPTIAVSMSDEDTIIKVSKLFRRPYYPNKRIGYKTLFRVTIHGTPAIEWMFTLYSLMSWRRQEKIREIINKWKTLIKHGENFPCGHSREDFNIKYSYKYKKCKTCANEIVRKYRIRKRLANAS